MEEKRETVNGPMLVAKRAKFKKQFNVPDAEQLKGDQWLNSFKRAYDLHIRK